MNLSLPQEFAPGARPSARCRFCAVRPYAPCGAFQDDAGLAELERSHAPLRHVPAGGALYAQGEPSERSFTILRGWVALTHVSRDGRQSILRFALPGDVLSSDQPGRVSAHSALAVGDVTVCALNLTRQARLEQEHPSFAARQRTAQAETLARADDSLVAMLGRSAQERIGHLLFGLATRSLRRALAPGDTLAAPLSQIQIGLATGLTAVHVSRTLRQLRESRVVSLEDHRLTVHDPTALARLAGASPEAAEPRP